MSIVIPKNSLTDLINAGLTVRHYTKKGEETKVRFVNEMEKEEFWNNIKKYADEKDRSLIILNLPLPSEETLKNIDLRPYEYSILYIPSEFITVTPQSRKILLEKGIVSMPQRDPYKCFPGEYIDKVEKRWMKIGKIVSFENELGSVSKRSIHIVKGLLKLIGENPLLAIQKIADDDVAFFDEAGKRPIGRIYKHIRKPDLEIVFTKGRKLDLIRIAFDHFLIRGKTPIGIKGEDESVILTDAPTFAHYIINKCNIKAKDQMKFGKGAAIIMDITDDANIGILIGRLSQRNVLVKFGKPKFVVKKTLIRKLVGGRGPEGRFYRGIKEKYPEIEIKKDIITIPRDAIENVIDALKETGTEFKIMA